MAQSSRPGSRRPNQSTGGGRRPRVAGLRKRARAEDPEERGGEATADSAAEEPASESSAAEPGSQSETQPQSETPSDSSSGAVAEESAAEGPSAPEKSEGSEESEDEESEEAAASSSANEEPPPGAATASETAGDTESDAASQATDSKSGASTPGAVKPRGKTGSSETARPTGRGKPRGTRVGATRSETSELPRAKPVQGSTTAVAEPEDTATTEAQSPDGAEDKHAWMRDRRVWFLGSLGLSVVFGLLAVLFGALSLGYLGGSQANEALTDQAATSEVNGQVTDAVNKVFSYDFANTKKTEDAAHQFLTGKAIQQYNDLFATVKQQAPQQKLVVTTTVKTSGVTRLQGDHAQVLLFVDQNATRTTTGENNVGPAQISVGAVKDGDQWKIDSITQR